MKLEKIDEARSISVQYRDICKILDKGEDDILAVDIRNNQLHRVFFYQQDSRDVLIFIKSMLKDKLIRLGVELP